MKKKKSIPRQCLIQVDCNSKLIHLSLQKKRGGQENKKKETKRNSTIENKGGKELKKIEKKCYRTAMVTAFANPMKLATTIPARVITIVPLIE